MLEIGSRKVIAREQNNEYCICMRCYALSIFMARIERWQLSGNTARIFRFTLYSMKAYMSIFFVPSPTYYFLTCGEICVKLEFISLWEAADVLNEIQREHLVHRVTFMKLFRSLPTNVLKNVLLEIQRKIFLRKWHRYLLRLICQVHEYKKQFPLKGVSCNNRINENRYFFLKCHCDFII